MNWYEYLKYNLLSKKLLDKVHSYIDKKILLYDIDYQNKLILRESKYGFKNIEDTCEKNLNIMCSDDTFLYYNENLF